MGDDNNSWRQFMDYHIRRNDGNKNGTSEDSNNNSNGGARSARSSSSDMLLLNQQQQHQASSSNGITSANESMASAGTSNSRDRLKETRSNEDGYSMLFHGPEWERQSMDLLQQSYQTDPSGLGGRRGNNPTSSELPSSTSSSHAHLKSPQSSAENLVGSGDCESSYYFGVFDNRCNHESHHEDVGGRCSAGPSSNPCRPSQITFPHPTMKLGVDSDSDEDSLDLYLEYYKQSAKDQQHKDGIRQQQQQQASPRDQAQSPGLRSEQLTAVPQPTQQPGTSRGLGILDMLEQLQALTRTRAAAAAASRGDASKSTGFSSLHNSMPFQSAVSHPGTGMYTTNENSLIVAQQYAEWEKEMDLAEDSAFSMDFYFDAGDMMDNTPTRSDMISSSRDLDTLTRQDSGMNGAEVVHQRRAASRFGLTAGLGQYQCQYSSLCPNAETSSTDYNLIRVADNPRGFTPRSYYEAAGGDGNAPSSPTSQTQDNAKSLVDDTTDLQKEVEVMVLNENKSICLDENAEGTSGTGDIYDLEYHEGSQYVLNKLTDGDALVAVETDAVTSSNESPTILEVQCEPCSENPFETTLVLLPSDGECSTRLNQGANSEDKILLSKISGIKSGLKNFKRRISSCFLHPRD